MTTLRDTTVGFGFIVTLTGHAKKNEDFWDDPTGEIDTLLRYKLGDRFDGIAVAAGSDARTGDGVDDGRVAVMLKGERGRGKVKKQMLGGYEASGLVAIKQDLYQPTQADRLILDEVVSIVAMTYGREIKKIDKFEDYGWIVVGTVI